MYSLGTMQNLGYGVIQNYSKAVQWYRKAGEQGHVMAQFNLAGMHHQGNGVKQDYGRRKKSQKDGKAVWWYRKAADQGNDDAQNNIGRMYSSGEGLKQDTVEAARWFRKAAEQGNADAQANLADTLDKRGECKEALLWFRRATKQGHSIAAGYVKDLEDILRKLPAVKSSVTSSRMCANCGVAGAAGSSISLEAVLALQGRSALRAGLPGAALEDGRAPGGAKSKREGSWLCAMCSFSGVHNSPCACSLNVPCLAPWSWHVSWPSFLGFGGLGGLRYGQWRHRTESASCPRGPRPESGGKR